MSDPTRRCPTCQGAYQNNEDGFVRKAQGLACHSCEEDPIRAVYGGKAWVESVKRNEEMLPILTDGLGAICSLMHVPPEMAPDVLKLIGVISGLLYGGVTARWAPTEVKADFEELLKSMVQPAAKTKEEADIAIAHNLATLEKFFQKVIAPIETEEADIPEGTSIQ